MKNHWSEQMVGIPRQVHIAISNGGPALARRHEAGITGQTYEL